MDRISSLVAGEVSRLAAEHSRRVTREEAAAAGQLAGDVVAAFLNLSRSDRARAAGRRGALAQAIVSDLLGVELSPTTTEAPTSPWYVEDWAGPVAGPTVLERDFGIPRSTLHKWQRDGHVIGLAKGRRKFAFPLRQFVDGRPVGHLREISAAFANSRDAWLWLVAPNNDLGCAPIDRLREGETEAILNILPG